MLCHYWYFKDIGFKFQPYARHDLSIMVYDLVDFTILIIEGVDYRCLVQNMNKSDAINMLNNSTIDEKGK